jgi:hypothetical protein
MEYENTHAASKGVAGTGLGLGIAGTALGLMAGGLNGVGLFGNANCNNSCSENHFVNRYEAAQSARIAELETEVKLRDANTFTMGEMSKLRDYVDGRFGAVEAQLCEQRVYNATLNSSVSCIQSQIAQLAGLTKIVIPNTSVCPGWGNVTVAPATTTTA